jgi:hypothetical protein
MAARGPAGTRGGSTRFAQFKLVLLGRSPFLGDPEAVFNNSNIGESAVGKVCSMQRKCGFGANMCKEFTRTPVR